MDLAQCTPCIFITCALLIIVCQTAGIGIGNGNGTGNGNTIKTACGSNSGRSESFTFDTAYFSHRVLFLTALGTLFLTLLGCLGCFCCCCYHWTSGEVENLDAYAPRTQSIVWPALPEQTARVLEVTFLHASGAVDCLCSSCERGRNMRCLENCLDASEC